MKFRYQAPFISIGVICFSLLAFFITVQFSPAAKAQTVSTTSSQNSIVGTWYVNANGAPFVPHVMGFHDDNTLIIDNPDAGDSHTSDSLGLGPWKKDGNTIKGKFVEVNADRTTHLFVNNLVVTFTIKLNDDHFTGPAEARYYDANWNLVDGPFPATLDGTRIKFNSLP